MIDHDLDAWAQHLGVITSYFDVAGAHHNASEATVRAVCDLLVGDDPPPSGDVLRIDDVVVVRGGRLVSGVGSTFDRPHYVLPVLEDGTELPAQRASAPSELALHDLPIGMHRLQWCEEGGPVREATLLVSPAHFARPARDRPGRTLFAPAYALWDDDAPMPSYDGLGRLAAAVAGLGVDTIATLPLYAPGSGDRFEASPYSPLSRFHWNELLVPDRLLDVAPGGRGEAVGDRVRWGDIEAARWAQLAALDADLGGRQRDDLAGFLARRPDVVSYAAYAAAGDRQRAGLHELAQWLAERALGDLLVDLDRRGQRLALDLPVGARQDSWETATWPHLFSPAASIGAPPDTFFAGGQNWALPPLIPTASRRDGHRVWHALLETACRYARVVRIDHVMQMHRLWWIPDGHAADDGVYVRYPAGELLAVAAIVAAQTGTTIVGEDLGTVPNEVSALIDDWHLIGMHEEVMTLHGLNTHGGEPPTLGPVPPGRWAGLRTHDMPALATTLAEVPTERYRRALEADVGHPLGDTSRDLMAGMVERLEASDAVDVVVDLDDVLGTTQPHNVPGVVDEFNWTRRIPSPVSALDGESTLAQVFPTVS